MCSKWGNNAKRFSEEGAVKPMVEYLGSYDIIVHQREGYRGDIQCQNSWPEHFQRSEMELSRVRNFPQGIHKALLPHTTEEGKHRNQGIHKFLYNVHSPGRRVRFTLQCFHNSLPSYLSDELEGLQRHAMRIIYPHVTYHEALGFASFSRDIF